MKLRCNFCKFQKDDFCTKLKEDLPNRFAKLHLGGVVGAQPKNTACKVEVEVTAKNEDFVTFQVWAPRKKEKVSYATR
jgi:hypothetical protein